VKKKLKIENITSEKNYKT